MEHFDVVVVGAGTAGAAAAAQLAARGLKTVCLDSRPLGESGARWVNGVAEAAFVDAGVAVPAGEELRSRDHRFQLVCGWGPDRVTVEGHGVLDVDMRLLVARLQESAVARGARLIGGARVAGLQGDVLSTNVGEFRARWFVDASGLSGANLLGSPSVPREDLCSAAQEVRQVTNHAAARAFFERHGAGPGDAVCFTSVAGGYSIVNVRLEDDHVSILTGSIPGLGHPSGRQLIDRFVHENRFVGDVIFGGVRAIPLSRPRDRLVLGRTIAIGDAAGQVFSAHGSGIGAGMVAARLLADALEREAPHDYAVRWQRSYGSVFAAYDVFRRLSQTLTQGEVRELMRAGLIDAASTSAAMQQQLPDMGVRPLVARLRAASRAPALASRLVPALVRMLAVTAAYRRYPRDPARLDVWASWARRL